MRRRLPLPPLLAALALFVAGCGSPLLPSASPAAGGWGRASVQQPDALTAAPSGPQASYCAPCHPSTNTQMRDVAAAGGQFIAIGSATPAAAIVWVSPDGRSWTRQPASGIAAGATLQAVTDGGDGSLVIVGSDGDAPAAWRSTDRRQWTRARLPKAVGAMTAVVAAQSGFVAAGYLGRQFEAQRAAFWTSTDGLGWTLAAADPVGVQGRVTALAHDRRGLVAVGSSDDAQHGPTASWTSTDGRFWARGPLELPGVMLGVVATSAGYVAVGRTTDGARAAAWTSTDGIAWRRVEDTPALASNGTYAPHAEMDDVVSVDGGLVAVGWNSSASNGSAVVWTSSDGTSWQRIADEPGLSGGGMSAVAVANNVAVAVGSSGWPDTHAATAWRHAG